MNHLITLIIPVYNGIPYLQETVEAALAQTYHDFTLLLINDGSSDESAVYLDSLTDPRVQVIHQKNQGLCATMNNALAFTKTPYVARCDQDDLCEPERLERQLEALTYSNYDVLFSHIVKFGEKRTWGNRDRQKVALGKIKTFTPFRDGCQLHCTLFGKTEVLRDAGYDAAYYPADDWEMELRLAQSGAKVGILQEPLVRYRFHPTAATYGTWQRMQDHRRWAEENDERRATDEPLLSLEEHLARATTFKRLNRRRKDLAKLYQRRGGEAWLHGNDIRALVYMGIGVLLNPLPFLRRAARLLL